MERVLPIGDRGKIEEVKKFLRKKPRDYCLFVLGINTGLRISDILSLKVSEVENKEQLSLVEQKTKNRKKDKLREIPLNNATKEAINWYLSGERKESIFLFPSRKGDKPISRVQAYRIINTVCRKVGINYKVGTHTLRKTFARSLYDRKVPLPQIMQTLNHTREAHTMRYLGITKGEIDKSILELNL